MQRIGKKDVANKRLELLEIYHSNKFTKNTMEIRNGGAVNILQKNFGNFFGDGTWEVCACGCVLGYIIELIRAVNICFLR